jgi:hypothetical protein
MHRFVIFLLLCVLPLQFALAGAADAFEHAGDGHSEQSHAIVADVKATVIDAFDTNHSDDASPRCHGECETCHVHHSLALFGSRIEALAITSAPDALSLPSADHQNRVTAQRPERPKWLQLA